jgi:intraflagellar transport protein 172
MTHCTVNHKIAIDFLELNTRGNIVVFRDKKRNLNLFDAISQTKIVILSCCGYAQWVPDSDVLTAQSRNKMCVWYNVNVINQVSFAELCQPFIQACVYNVYSLFPQMDFV